MPGAEIIPLATVLDASVAVRWIATEPGTAAAIALLRRPTRWIAPRLLLTEVAGALHRKIGERRIRDVAATEALDALLNAVDRGEIQLAEDERFMAAALMLATLMSHKVADCVYVALAEHEGAALATADRRLASLAERRGVATTLLS
ncbi:MAG TPA: type II toxin-antitoxin system VapC family toxin [Geminicoccaceae bacterium]|jgi:predicted nucleic acid-binding protein|nr:type II toxin-antitoxin system VapC family toxin [Geminicoccaceae bacterium]